MSVSSEALLVSADLAYTVLLQPLPCADQDHTVLVWQRGLASHAPVIEVALGEVERWRLDPFGALRRE